MAEVRPNLRSNLQNRFGSAEPAFWVIGRSLVMPYNVKTHFFCIASFIYVEKMIIIFISSISQNFSSNTIQLNIKSKYENRLSFLIANVKRISSMTLKLKVQVVLYQILRNQLSFSLRKLSS